MSFSRAFSTRRKQPEMEISAPMFIGRAASHRGGKPVLRTQISSPMTLLSTSNQHIHHAQHISGTSPIEIRHVSSGSTSSSSEESDARSGSSIHSHDTQTDASSVDNSPVSPEAEHNHLSCYFKPAVDTTHSRSPSALTASTRPSMETPRLPARAPSHSKRAHEGVHRKRSIQRMLSPPPSRHSERSSHAEQTTYRSSTDMFLPHTPSRPSFSAVEAPKSPNLNQNPFGAELAQLDEVAEEFGQTVRRAERDADEVWMETRGLGKFDADEYGWEIKTLLWDCFGVGEYDEVVVEEGEGEGFGGFF
ncbi:uncharacterized protein LTR77_003746 [Saxophila tyrrhenica]|uniref:Uncharacterized protein n=1 Tax=Saxophila tyrrhenica TaxID=1690608 RepID=A0AAV9PH58_9PEZI|nr:hypothetical protein LTR77_003746 [Saxophila tyrrhenica]